jgi:WD40 repeat protein/formylglycine-generating enzyme required for sulfatase activity/tetratricopeptide (TPR) repeat protein
MNRPEKLWPLLHHSRDPRARSYLIHALSPLGADARAIVKQLNRESDVTIRRALLLSLSEFSQKDFTPEDRKVLLPKLYELYRTAPDAGLHAAAEWLLRQWNEDAWLKETNQAQAGDKQQQLARLEEIQQELKKETSDPGARWYVNGQGQTLVVIPGPVEFWMGSPPTEQGRGGPVSKYDELRHWRRIGRSFAIASKEITVQQFLRFRKDHPVSRPHAPSEDCPVNNVSWYDATAYCNWLSEQEGIPKEQWCYEPNAAGQYAPGMKMAANYLQRTGYRLPTEAEWEYACRAGAATGYSFGESEELLPRYAWYQKNWEGRLRPVGSLKPNDLGLFDMHGNDWEWCQDEYKPYPKGEDGKATEDKEDPAEIDHGKWRILRGGVFYPMGYERSAARGGNHPGARIHWNGLRPVRSLPFSSFDRYAAARAAALAAAGQGKSQFPDAAKVKLRRQALDWLKAELADWSKVQPPRVFVARTLWHWQQDSALAGIRDQAALAKLPAAEQKAFTRFWADVAKTVAPADSAERLEFARVAVLIAAGQGKDEPPLDDAAKAKLRRQAISWLKAELTVTVDRAGRAMIIAAAAPLPGLLEKLAESTSNDGPFQAELARHYAERGNSPLANTASTKARAVFEAQLAKEPENSGLAADLAEVLLIESRTKASTGGAALPERFVRLGPLKEANGIELVDYAADGVTEPAEIEGQQCRLVQTGSRGWGHAYLAIEKGFKWAPSMNVQVEIDYWADSSGSCQIQYDSDDDSYNRSQAPVQLEGSRGWKTARFTIKGARFANSQNGRADFRVAVATAGRFYLKRVSVRRLFPGEDADNLWVRLAAAYGLNGRNDKATEYFAKALQADPKLGDDRQAQHRFHAARAAALAAAGQGKDEPQLDNAAKAKLRRQVLDWLKAELTVWTKQLDGTAKRAEYVWIEDDIPPGAKPFVEVAGIGIRVDQQWTWVTRPQHPVFSGSRASVVTADRLGQLFFEAAPVGLKVGAGDTLFAHVYLDPARPPREIMFQWNTGSWLHRAYWGDNVIPFGRDASTERLGMGPLPEAGKWVRLEVDAARVGIKPGMVISGWAFTQHAGTVYWDKAGIVTQTPQGEQEFATAPPEIIVPTLRLWRKDPDLAGIRDAAALAKLPAQEQKQWQALWAEVAAALRFRLPRTGPHSEMRQDRAGKWLAIPNGEAVALFDARTGELMHTLTGHSDRVHTVAFSPDGRYLAGGNLNRADAKAMLLGTWKVKVGPTFETEWRFEANGTVHSSQGQPKGKWTTGQNSVLIVWNDKAWDSLNLPLDPNGSTGNSSHNPSWRVVAHKVGAGGDRPYVIKIWDLQTLKVTATLQGVPGLLWTVGFDGDGKRLFCGGEKGLDVWDLASGKIVRSFAAGDGANGFYSFGLSPDGKKLAWGNASKKVKVWEIGSDNPPMTLDGHKAGIQHAAYSPDGKLLATGSDTELLLWDAEKLQLVKKIDTRAAWLAWGPDGKTLLTATHDPKDPTRLVTRWDLANFQSQPLLLPNRGTGHTVYHLSPDGKTMFSLINDDVGMEQRVWVNDLLTLAKRYPAILQGEKKPADNAERLQVARIAYDRKQFAAATRLWAEALASEPKLGDDCLLKPATSGEPARVPPEVFAIRGDARFLLPKAGRSSWMATDRGGKFLAIPVEDVVAIFDTRTGELVRTLTGHTDRVYAVAFSPDGKFLAGGNWTGEKKSSAVKVWDLKTGDVTVSLDSEASELFGVNFSRDGKRLFASSVGGVQMWDMTGKLVRTFNTGTPAHGFYQLGLSPDGKHLVCNDTPTTAKVWEIEGDNPPETLGGHTSPPLWAAYSPDGKLLVTGSDKELLLWDAEKLELTKKIDTPAGWLAFGPDGKTILTAQHHSERPLEKDVVTRWDLTTYEGKPLPPLTRRKGWPVYHLSPDGKTLYSLVVDGQDREQRIRVNDAATGRALIPAPGATDQVSSVAFSPVQAHLRYIAACAAALAAAGQGQDEPPQGDAAKAKLRGQALDWLKAELTVWRKLFESGPPQDRPAIVQTLLSWQQDIDLAGIRDAAALAKLAVDEQKQWQSLWAQVPELRTVVPTSKEKEQRWRYTTVQPAEGWQKADFDDKEWKDGRGAFVRTQWNTPDVWLRREFMMPEGTEDDLLLLLAHDDDAEVYLNGVLALVAPGYCYYEEMPLRADARQTLKPGKNVLAVHCRIAGPQHFDVGIVAVKGNAARLALARIAQDRRRFAFAAELWAAALASDPKLGEDRLAQHRYSAARAAALAAAGLANDELPPSGAAKAKLRGQALNWLRAELTAWTKDALSGPAQDQASIVQALGLWRKESDLAGIRDAAMLAMLPAEEQKALGRLWADVAALLSKQAEEQLNKHPDDLATVEALTGVLVDKLEAQWTALVPLTAKSEGGATLTVLPDASVLASGVSPDRDVYVIEADVQGQVGAIRLEAIPDPSMPEGGSGRSGTFILTDIRVTVGDSAVKWAKAIADFSQESPNSPTSNHPVHFAIDADESTGWAVWPHFKEPHWAVFLPARPVGGGDKTRLTIRLAFQNKDFVKHTLGRFRLSVASEKSIIPQSEWFLAAKSPHARLGAAYLAQSDARRAKNVLTKATTANPKLPAADWLVLALAHARLKETAQVRSVCSKAAELLTPTDAALRPLLREVVSALGPGSPEATTLLAAVAGKPPAALNVAIGRNLDKAEGYRNRADWFVERGLWKQASADLAEAFRLEPNAYTGLRLGVILAYTGEIERNRAHCRAMLQRWASTEDNGEADMTLKTIVLLPDFKADAKQLARLAKVAVSGNKQVDWFEWWMLGKGLYDYRTAKYAEALTTCRESRRRAAEGQGARQALACMDLAIEAMALHRCGEEPGAKRALAEAKSNVEAHVPGIDGGGWSHDWLFAHMLYHEAEGLMAGMKAEQPK